ncbi:hypothetical protein FPE01S_07_00580 [Flavihumibacter petaseus NBRC 106054]|uniref:Uncharacterized protein n=1 Tax=Flavihumibacter petaseus NBRC 106054 TaxID=1220578 RepID=A0A0E9N8F1_9BACT|nr:hypothetical protein FPE01S_07_00580 [Flavihumibacter petaseus NBRC 106054]
MSNSIEIFRVQFHEIAAPWPPGERKTEFTIPYSAFYGRGKHPVNPAFLVNSSNKNFRTIGAWYVDDETFNLTLDIPEGFSYNEIQNDWFEFWIGETS